MLHVFTNFGIDKQLKKLNTTFHIIDRQELGILMRKKRIDKQLVKDEMNNLYFDFKLGFSA